jgi:hypothetical protein
MVRYLDCDRALRLHNAGINDVCVPEHVHHAALLCGSIHRARVAVVTVVHGGRVEEDPKSQASLLRAMYRANDNPNIVAHTLEKRVWRTLRYAPRNLRCSWLDCPFAEEPLASIQALLQVGLTALYKAICASNISQSTSS